VHFKKFEEILHFLKTNEIIRSYVLRKLPEFISEGIQQVFSKHFPLFREISKSIPKDESKTLTNFIQKNFLSKEEKPLNKTNLFPGQVNYDFENLYQNFKTLNLATYIKNQALIETLIDFAHIPEFNNTETAYFYSSPNAYKAKTATPVKALKKLMKNIEFDAWEHQVRTDTLTSGASYKKKYTRVINTNPRFRLSYLQRIIEIEAHYPDMCKSFLSNLASIIQKQNKIIIQDLIMHPKYLKFLGLGKSQIEDMYHEFFYSEINDWWFKKESFIDDKIFKISCEVLSFLSIKNLTNIPNYEILEIHLKSSIDMLKELDITFALEHKFSIIHKVLENISFLIHYVNETSILPGNEEILVVFIWCVIQAKCETMKSNFRFLQLFVNDDQKMGELGFAITQLEAAIMYIGKSKDY
jgi:hypothetical protein